VEAGLIEKVGNIYPRVKILNNGELKKKLTVKGCQMSGGAKAAIEKAGGTVNHV
jgi:ribosomal protein L15